MVDLKPIVDILLKKHGGGTPFFDELDKTLRNPYFYLALYRSAERSHGLAFSFDGVAVSGEFGRGFVKWMRGSAVQSVPAYLYPGDLRHNPERALEKQYPSLKGKHIAFIDDSVYKGRTFRAVLDAVERDGGYICGPFVLYDGSRGMVADTHSFYRYFDHHLEKLKG
jgi:hypothetical protein